MFNKLDKLDFNLEECKANELIPNENILVKKSLGIQEVRVLEVNNLDNGKLGLTIRDFFSLEMNSIIVSVDEIFFKVNEVPFRKIITEDQLRFRG